MFTTNYSIYETGGDILTLEENISKCIEDKGIALTVVSRRTGISYMALYDSLRNKSKKRELKGKELIKLCKFLDIDSRDFADKEPVGQ